MAIIRDIYGMILLPYQMNKYIILYKIQFYYKMLERFKKQHKRLEVTMNHTLQFYIDILMGALVLMIACTNLTPLPIKVNNILFIITGIFIMSIHLLPIVGNFLTYLMVGYVIFVVLIGQKKKFQIFILGIIGYIFNVLFNYLCMAIIYFITGINIMQIGWYLQTLFTICYILLLYITTSAIKQIYKRQINYFINQKFNTKIIIYICLFTTICACILITNFASSQYLGYPLFSILLNCFLFLLYFAFTIIMLYQIIRSIKQDLEKKSKLEEYKNLQEYTAKLEDLYQQMRSFKHDYINILATLNCYIEQRDFELLNEYFHNKILPTGKQFSKDTASLGKLANIQILELKGLLYQKFIRASSLNLQLNIDIPTPLTSTNSMKPIDLSRLMGIFLDNAIEAAFETEEKYLFCGLLENEDNIIICLTNSCNMNRFPIEKLYENGFTTKDTGYGLGLFNAKEILKNYPNVIHHTEYKNNRFTQELYIPQ